MMTRSDILQALDLERKAQYKKWGDQSGNSIGRWLGILIEELGEASKGYLDSNYDNYRHELIHAGAVIVAMIEHAPK